MRDRKPDRNVSLHGVLHELTFISAAHMVRASAVVDRLWPEDDASELSRSRK